MIENYLIKTVIYFNNFVLYYLISVNLIYTILFIISILALYRYHKKIKYWSYEDMIRSSYTPPLSIIVPCYNEEKTIVDNVKGLLSLEYGEFEIIIVNDGSSDSSLKVLKEAFKLQQIDMPYNKQIKTEEIKNIFISSIAENIIVLNKNNGGKADALNAGINICRYPLFTAIDADSIIERSSLLKVVRPFIEDPNVIVSGGIVRPVNGSTVDKGFIERIRLPKKSLSRLQIVEYLRAFLFGRLGWGLINALMIVSGAFGVFNKKVVIESGGYTSDTIGEDMELIVKIHRKMKEEKKKYKIVFIPDPVCWTQVPEDMKILKSQRMRWHKGLMDTILNHKKMLFNPKYGVIGFVAFPYYFFVEMIGPVIEILGYIFIIVSFWFNLISYEFVFIFFGFAVVYGVFLSLGAILLEEYNFKKYGKVSEFLILVFYSIIENFGYRQVTTIWRFLAFFQYRRKNNKWGDMTRKEFDT